MTWLDDLTLDTVIVHTSDQSFRGVKAAVHDDGIVLRDAFVLGAGREMIDGLLFIPRANVLYIQLISGDPSNS